MCSPPLPIKLSGKHKGFQPIESLLRTLLSSSPVTDSHFSLIHNFKVSNGLRVRKEVIWLSFNSPKRTGSRKSRWLFPTVMFSWSSLLDKTLIQFSIHFFPDNMSRRVRTSPSDLVLKMLSLVAHSSFIFKPNWSTLITNQRPLLSAQSLISLLLSLVLRTNFLLWLSRSKSQILNKPKRNWSANKTNSKSHWLV